MKTDDHKTEFKDQSYSRHASHYLAYAPNGKLPTTMETWLDKDTLDTWRHRRMYDCLLPLLRAAPGSTWLTVGDGRLGLDAQYLIKHGCNALPTDIADTLLKIAKEKGLIPDYRKENAEALSFANDSFDYVLCKESYHHFPRPMIAFYEILRVARKAIVLIEPDDHYINETLRELIFRKSKDWLRAILGKENLRHVYEEVGNYAYAISRREVEKAAVALDFRYVAFTGVNDFFVPECGETLLGANTALEKRTRRMIKLQDLACRLGIKRPRVFVSVIFKEEPGEAVIESLRAGGYAVIKLPKNPYAKSDNQ
jgi:ubiquinone/menaquinone biosynthesis C-methylase UbiE